MSTQPVVSGTEGYAEAADDLVQRYEALAFVAVHRWCRNLLPDPPARILDVGSGTGRDAAGFAALGHKVVAVEPTAALRCRATALHASERIEWLDDSLPDLRVIGGREEVFDAVLLTAVWMHLDAVQRERAMPNVARLVRPGGVLLLSQRHGPVPVGRRMFDVTPDETVALAASSGLNVSLSLPGGSDFRKRPGVTWDRLAFRRHAVPERSAKLS